MQIEFVDRARGYSYFLEVPSASGWGNGVGGWIGVLFVVVEGCLREHRLYRVRSVWIPSRSRWKGGGRTRYCRIKSWYPVTFNGSSHPYMIIRRPAARSFFRWVVKQGLDFSSFLLSPRLDLCLSRNRFDSMRSTLMQSFCTIRRIPKILVLVSRAIEQPWIEQPAGMTCSTHKVFLGGNPFRNWVTAATWSR